MWPVVLQCGSLLQKLHASTSREMSYLCSLGTLSPGRNFLMFQGVSLLKVISSQRTYIAKNLKNIHNSFHS